MFIQKKKLLLLCAVVLCIVLFFTYYFFTKKQSVIDNLSIYWSSEWQTVHKGNAFEKKTSFSGSEVDFKFKNVSKFTITGTTTNTDDDTSLVVILDKKSITIPVKKINKGYVFTAFPDSNVHTFRMIFYCRGWFSPCNVNLTNIEINGGEILASQQNRKVFGMLGDSISLLYAKDNYSSLLSQEIDYQLHNASIWGRSLSHTGKTAPAIQKVNNDLIPYKPNLVVLNLGTNDILDSVKESDFTADYKKLIDILQTSLPNSIIVVMSIMPGKSHQLKNTTDIWNADIQKLLPAKMFYIDTTQLLNQDDYLDAVHPNPRGQKKLANFLHQYLVDHKLL